MLQINPPLVNQLATSHSTISEKYELLKEKLTTLVHMTVFLKHDELIQTEGLIETFTHALNFLGDVQVANSCAGTVRP